MQNNETCGIKVIDKDDAQIYKHLEYAKTDGHPVEVGFYRNDQQFYDFLDGTKDAIVLNFHFNHNDYSVFELSHQNGLEKLERDIKLAKKYGARYAVMHTAKSPMSRREAYHKTALEHLYGQFAKLDALCRKHGFAIHLENTYESLPFYRELFAGLRERGIETVNFCFDLGHAKVWSNESFEEWMVFLEELKASGRKLHFHLHCNRGLYDEHLSLPEVETLGILKADPIFSDKSYPEMVKTIFAMFQEEIKIFEVKPDFVIENLQYIKSTLESK